MTKIQASDRIYMQRCLDLAIQAGKNTLSNPMVGAILVCNNKIIGEGFHAAFGQQHAEVNALKSVSAFHQKNINLSTLYVSLEPCSHFGKTPPCVHKIIESGIRKVIIGCTDPNPLVSGAGIQYLRNNGVEVICPVLETESQQLISKFKANLKGLPYIILKWAQSADGFISKKGEKTWLTNDMTGILTHKWRSECDAILVGKNTAIIDNPALNVRHYYPGPDPIRILLDTKLQSPQNLKIYHPGQATWIIHSTGENKPPLQELQFLNVNNTRDLKEILSMIYKKGVFCLLVEGGSEVLNSFLKAGHWHEARVIRTDKKLEDGIPAPQVEGTLKRKKILINNEILYIQNPDDTQTQ